MQLHQLARSTGKLHHPESESSKKSICCISRPIFFLKYGISPVSSFVYLSASFPMGDVYIHFAMFDRASMLPLRLIASYRIHNLSTMHPRVILLNWNRYQEDLCSPAMYYHPKLVRQIGILEDTLSWSNHSTKLLYIVELHFCWQFSIWNSLKIIEKSLRACMNHIFKKVTTLIVTEMT